MTARRWVDVAYYGVCVPLSLAIDAGVVWLIVGAR